MRSRLRLLRPWTAALLLTAWLMSFAQASSLPEHRGFILKLRQGRSAAGLLQAYEVSGGKVVSRIPELGLVVTESDPQRTMDRAWLSEALEYVEPNRVVRASGVGASSGSLDLSDSRHLWGMQAIHAPGAWEITTGDRGVVVAVSDTGSWYSHAELQPNLWKNPGESGRDAQGRDKSSNGIDDDGNGFVDDVLGWNFETHSKDPVDYHDHGTHVAGTIGALGGNRLGVAGVAWNTSLMTVKFLGHDGSGTLENGIRTILYAADNGARVVNCSWGGDGYSRALWEAIEYAKTKGTLIVAAAGNSSSNNDLVPAFPASYDNDNLIAVAAISQGATPRLAEFSNYGPQSVDLAAPGVDIESTLNPLASGSAQRFFGKFSGTSMAAPHVSGALALIYSANPHLSWWEAKEIVLSSVRRSSKLEGKVATSGVLDVEEAVKAAVSWRGLGDDSR